MINKDNHIFINNYSQIDNMIRRMERRTVAAKKVKMLVRISMKLFLFNTGMMLGMLLNTWHGSGEHWTVVELTEETALMLLLVLACLIKPSTITTSLTHSSHSHTFTISWRSQQQSGGTLECLILSD